MIHINNTRGHFCSRTYFDHVVVSTSAANAANYNLIYFNAVSADHFNTITLNLSIHLLSYVTALNTLHIGVFKAPLCI